MIAMDFKKPYDRIYRKTMEENLQAMNISDTIIDLMKLLYTELEAIIITNDKKETDSKQREVCAKDTHSFRTNS